MFTIDEKALEKIFNDKNIYDIVGDDITALSEEEAVKEARKLGKEFKSILLSEIKARSAYLPRDGGLGETAISALSDIYVSKPKKSSIKPNTYEVSIGFNGSMIRESFSPGKVVHDISKLLNNGINYEGDAVVWGSWHDEGYRNIPYRLGSHFMQDSVRLFTSKYGASSGVEVILDSGYAR